MTTIETTPAALVTTLFERLNAHDIAGIRNFWRADTEERFPDGTRRGPDEIGAWFDGLLAAAPDLRVQVVSLVEQGEEVFVRWKAAGTHTGGPFQGIAATGNDFVVDGVDHFVIRDGKVASNFVIFDQMQFARAVGVLPADGSGPDRAMRAAFNAKTRLVERVRASRR
jgi:ketosteroid isomerase-like protein